MKERWVRAQSEVVLKRMLRESEESMRNLLGKCLQKINN